MFSVFANHADSGLFYVLNFTYGHGRQNLSFRPVMLVYIFLNFLNLPLLCIIISFSRLFFFLIFIIFIFICSFSLLLYWWKFYLYSHSLSCREAFTMFYFRFVPQLVRVTIFLTLKTSSDSLSRGKYHHIHEGVHLIMPCYHLIEWDLILSSTSLHG